MLPMLSFKVIGLEDPIQHQMYKKKKTNSVFKYLISYLFFTCQCFKECVRISF